MGPSYAGLQTELTESIAGSVAISMTISRLWIRRDRYWWDDAWALFSMTNLIAQIVSVFMHAQQPGQLSKSSLVAAYYIMACTFYAVIWSARLSILFSIIRLDSDPVARRKLMWLAGVFVAAIAFFIAQLLWVCEPHPEWKTAMAPQCRLDKQVAICQLVSDVIADFLLIMLPLRLIHGVKDKRLRRRVIFIFSTSLATSVVSLVHAAYILTSGGKNVLISALVEDCISLTVANVPVVGSLLLRKVARHRETVPDTDSDVPDVGATSWSSFRRLTGRWALSAPTSLRFAAMHGSGAVRTDMMTSTQVTRTTTTAVVTCSTQMTETTAVPTAGTAG
ncbi:hypothetical protein FA95DRAFT_1552700 [Auriscalpium vulgare]|uniref:Uncharacterized protein n=1 Tax=Auriscalpium vulgare TaxID=40419 RepID=A0ACB8SBB5_9AGAM|nr:hypothetical protein FA95DRAFT_1552700 [Auriscalpium vulgare]